jgi:Telomeric single stranded DNA binding POT1/CDC13
MEEDNEDWVQFYGVIIDATFPYKVSENKYMCNLKVIDPSLNCKDSEGEFSIVLIQGRRFQDLPIVQRIGDIIRCHRAEYTNRGDQHYLKLNLHYNSSWALFSADDEVAPEVNG